MKQRVLVFSVDAMVYEDLQHLRSCRNTKKVFSERLRRPAYQEHLPDGNLPGTYYDPDRLLSGQPRRDQQYAFYDRQY